MNNYQRGSNCLDRRTLDKYTADEMQKNSGSKCDQSCCWTARAHQCGCLTQWASGGVPHHSLILLPDPGQRSQIVPRTHPLWYGDGNILSVSIFAGKKYLPFHLKLHRLYAQQRKLHVLARWENC